MSPKAMIWASVILSALAQISLKHGLSQVSAERRGGSKFRLVVSVVRQRYVWLWAASFAVATALWLLGLRQLELSYAYPLLAFGYVVVNVLSAALFREHVDANRWLAVAVISAGVFLIAGS